MIVVDTNIIGYLYLSSDRSVSAEQVLVKDPLWAAPILWRSELRNVLALYIRKQILSLADALRIAEEAVDLMQDQEYEVKSLHVLRLVASSACSAYDCEFVALAEDLNVRLVTVDRKIVRQFPAIAVSLEAFVDS